MISKKVFVPVFIFTALSAGLIFKTSIAHAITTTPHSDIFQFLAQKLGVDQSKVESAFIDYRNQQYTTYLDGLVKQGKITETQKSAILAKHVELQKNHLSSEWLNKTPTERKTLMGKQRADLESWAKSQGIDVQYLQFGLGRGMMGSRAGKDFGNGRGMMGGFNR